MPADEQVVVAEVVRKHLMADENGEFDATRALNSRVPVVKGEVEMYEIPAFHGNIIHGERTEKVAAVLRASLDAARAEASAGSGTDASV